jgi:uncharacterized repeat protein (TIGR03803 family)
MRLVPLWRVRRILNVRIRRQTVKFVMLPNYPKGCLTRTILCTALAVAVLLPAVPYAAEAQTVTTILNFPNTEQSPMAVIAQGRDGDYYGETTGTIYKVTASGALTQLHTIAASEGQACNGLMLGTDGNFYGTCFNGGNNGNSTGTFFQVTPAGTLTVLHYFDGLFSGTTDGCYPVGLPVQGPDGNFYGTARGCGLDIGGMAYKITPAGLFTAIHAFAGGSDAQNPTGTLIVGSDGNLWGTSYAGGTTGSGTIFKMTTAGVVTVVYQFSGCGAGTNGCNPQAGLVLGNDGFYFGVAESGGANDQGAIFKVSPAGVLTVLHSFNRTVDNGAYPQLPLTLGTDGNFYGVATDCLGGGCSAADIFKITSKGVFTDLYNFPNAGGNNNSLPFSPLLLATNGTFYSATEQDGSSTGSNTGTFFSLVDGQTAFALLQETSGRVGSKIGILGQGFSASSVVKFNGKPATIVARTGTTFLLATVPAGATDGFVTVTTGTTTLTSSKKFIVHNSWSSGTAMPTARAGGAIGVIGLKVYVVSGETSSAIVTNNEIYNVATNKWTTGAPIPTPRYAVASAVVNGILYVMGGIDNSTQTPIDVVEAYNPTTNTWSTKSPMPTPDDSMNAVVESGLIYVVGGYASGARSAIVQRYDPATDTWTSEASLLVAKSSSVLGLVGTTIISSGGLENTNSPSGDTEGYDAATNTWGALTADPTPRNGGCGAPVAGQLYVTGGSDAGILGNATTVTESYNLAKNAWATLLPAPLAVIGALPAVSGNQLYCFGGTDNGSLFTGKIYNNVQIYQP